MVKNYITPMKFVVLSVVIICILVVLSVSLGYIVYTRTDISQPVRRITNETRRLLNSILEQPESKKKTSASEELVREIMQNLFEKPFPKQNPSFLLYPKTGRHLELDMYNEELKLACEYNGIQHYQYPNFTNQTYEEYKEQIARDEFKVKCCKEKGVQLVVIPYTIKPNYMRKYIVNKLTEFGYTV
jgi:hypothetical protein